VSRLFWAGSQRADLRVRGYVRYMDDFLLYGDDRAELREHGDRIRGKLAELRLRIHPDKYRLMPTAMATLTGDARRFRLAAEAHRIRLAYQYDPHFAVSVSQIDPLGISAASRMLLSLLLHRHQACTRHQESTSWSREGVIGPRQCR